MGSSTAVEFISTEAREATGANLISAKPFE